MLLLFIHFFLILYHFTWVIMFIKIKLTVQWLVDKQQKQQQN